MISHKIFIVLALLITGVGIAVIQPLQPTTASCLTTTDVLQAHARSRDGISSVCNETIRQAQVNEAARMQVTSTRLNNNAADRATDATGSRQRVIQ